MDRRNAETISAVVYFICASQSRTNAQQDGLERLYIFFIHKVRRGKLESKGYNDWKNIPFQESEK